MIGSTAASLAQVADAPPPPPVEYLLIMVALMALYVGWLIRQRRREKRAGKPVDPYTRWLFVFVPGGLLLSLSMTSKLPVGPTGRMVLALVAACFVALGFWGLNRVRRRHPEGYRSNLALIGMMFAVFVFVALEDTIAAGLGLGESSPIMTGTLLAIGVLVLLAAFFFARLHYSAGNRMSRMLGRGNAVGALALGESIAPAKRHIVVVVNLAVAYARLNRWAEAETQFAAARELATDEQTLAVIDQVEQQARQDHQPPAAQAE